MFKMLQKKEGFTLVELLVVVAIIGILAATALPKLLDQIDVAKRGTAKADIGAFNSALQVYNIDVSDYPNTLNDMTTTYMASIPNDPWGTPYTWTNTTNDYTIISYGGGASRANDDPKKKGWDIIYNANTSEIVEQY